jgi:hypothetical protein
VTISVPITSLQGWSILSRGCRCFRPANLPRGYPR